jgi:hypothetical protein
MNHIDNDGNAPDAAPETDPHGLTDSTVGYGKPPMKRRFKSGESGNRRGRPRGSKNRKTIVRKIMNETHAVTEDGQRRRRSTIELVLLALRNRAVEGNVRAFRAYKKFLAKHEPQGTHSDRGCLVVPATLTPEEAIAEGEKANAEARAKRAAQCRE